MKLSDTKSPQNLISRFKHLQTRASARSYRLAGPPRRSTSEERVFLELLDRCISDARIRVNVNGTERIVGGGEACTVAIRVHNPRLFARVLAYRNLGLGEAYMDGDFDIEEGTLEDLLIILLRNRIDQKVRGNVRLALKVGWVQFRNALRSKHRNVQRHYDVGDDLFEAMLDPTMAYTCGYARSQDDSLPQLQQNKFERICKKLRLQPGDRLLDIGCGFGGMLIHAARNYGVSGVGITNSRRHCERGNANIARVGLADRIRLDYQDYRDMHGEFDKVVSIGMMEHVPHHDYGGYIKRIARVLTPRGMGLVHAIGCNTYKCIHDPFIQKYIFPGSGQPKLSEIAHELEQNCMPILDVENMGRHYEPTARAWLKNFEDNKDSLDPNRYDEVFLRMWKYYLCCGIAAAAAANDSAVYQVLFTKEFGPLPWSRV